MGTVKGGPSYLMQFRSSLSVNIIKALTAFYKYCDKKNLKNVCKISFFLANMLLNPTCCVILSAFQTVSTLCIQKNH